MEINEKSNPVQDLEAQEKERYWHEFRAIGGSRDHFEEFWPAQWQRLSGHDQILTSQEGPNDHE
jgi:hypothetical protein